MPEHIVSIRQFLNSNGKTVLIIIIILITFGVKTITRNTAWKNNYTLFSEDVQLSPKSARTHYNYGSYLLKEEFLKGRPPREQDSLIQTGIKELKIAVAIHPPFTDAWNLLGVMHHRIQQHDSSLKFYLEALNYNPSDPAVHNNIGTLFYEHGNYAEAIKAFKNAVRLNPNSAEALTNLGSCLGAMKYYDEALRNFRSAIIIDPGYAPAYYLMGIAYRITGRQEEAQFYLNKAAELGDRRN